MIDTEHLPADAVLEQAKGALAFRFSLDTDTALGVLDLWASESGRPVEAVARALVHGICPAHASPGADPAMVQWLQDRLGGTCPEVAATTLNLQPVRVVVDHSYTSLDDVVAGARRAARLGVPLELRLDEPRGEHAGHVARAHLMQRVDLAVELARAVEPGLVVRLPACGLLAPS